LCSGQIQIQGIATPQLVRCGEGQLAIIPDCAQQLIALIELGAFRHAAQHQAVEYFTAIAIREGNLNVDRVIHLGRLYQSQLTRGLIDGINAVVKLHMLYVMERLDDPDAPFTHAEIKPGIMD